MISLSIWLVSIALELLLVVRGVQQKLIHRFPFFYTYISFVLAADLLFFAIRLPAKSPLYLYLYWCSEFLSLVLGCLVFFELYRVALNPYPGTARMARALLAVLFGLIRFRFPISYLCPFGPGISGPINPIQSRIGQSLSNRNTSALPLPRSDVSTRREVILQRR